MSVVDLADLEQQVWSIKPGPGELPGNRWPPLPTTTTSHRCLSLIIRSINPVDSTKVLVELARDEEDDQSEEELLSLA